MYFVDIPVQTTTPVAQLEAMPVIKQRKPRPPKHDFKDGALRVLAHKHENGGGWVADTASVEPSVYVGRKCEIFNRAIVKGSVRLEGNARISGAAVVSGGVVLSKNAQVYGKAVVRDATKITDDARVFGEAHVSGDSLLFDTASVCESAQLISTTLRYKADIRGSALVVRSALDSAGMTLEIKGNCSIIHSNIRGHVLIGEQAQIIRSNMSNVSQLPINISGFAIIADQSNICMPIVIKDHAVLIHSVIHYSPATPENVITINNRMVMQHQTFHNRVQLDAYINMLSANGGRLGAAQIMANGQIAPLAARRLTPDGPPAPRRLMRLQEAATV